MISTPTRIYLFILAAGLVNRQQDEGVHVYSQEFIDFVHQVRAH